MTFMDLDDQLALELSTEQTRGSSPHGCPESSGLLRYPADLPSALSGYWVVGPKVGIKKSHGTQLANAEQSKVGKDT